MKIFLSFIVCFMTAVTVHAQQDTIFVNKFYYSPEQIIADSPADTVPVIPVVERDVFEILVDDGNTYIPLSPKKCPIKQGALKKEIWAVGHDSTLYLNGHFITKTKGYMKAETRGKYILLMTSLPMDWSICQQLGILEDREEVDMMLRRAQNERSGISGNVTGGSPLVVKGHQQYPIVFDILTGTVRSFTDAYIQNALTAYPAVKDKYQDVSTSGMSHADKISFVNEMNRAYMDTQAK